MSTSKLSLYNGALRLLKERPLASLSENREPRRILDSAWDGGAIDYCLEAAQWKFAKRTAMIDASPSITPAFGFEFGFDLPADHLRTVGVWSDEFLTSPHRGYREEAGFWYGSLETMFVSYVSNDVQWGMDLTLWPQGFVKFVEAHLASELVGPLAETYAGIIKLRDKLLLEAKSDDAMADPTMFPPVSAWVQARRGGRFSREN